MRQGFGAVLGNLGAVAAQTMVLQRFIRAPRAVVWNAWENSGALLKWRWPDGMVYANHHRYGEMRSHDRTTYALLWGENGPKHADACTQFAEEAGDTRVTLSMVFLTLEEFQTAKGFGAVELGLQTLGKLARFVGAD